MKPRKHLIDVLSMQHGSLGEFTFDSIMGPGILQLMNVTQIGDLHELATSIKYSAKIKQKYEMIDQIMAKSGFREFHAGTNRRIFHHPDFSNLIAKIALDEAGLKDSPSEYQNQFIFMPFCTKVFDVSPDGTVGFMERFEPILTREMYEQYADLIYDVILMGMINNQYAVADIGTSYFMNWGIRPGFGPGLLDFPYAYKLDNNKIYCKDILPNGLPCLGTIHPDEGFNEYVCDHCGKTYEARDLEMAVKENKIELIGGNTMELKMSVQIGSETVFDNTSEIEETNAITPTRMQFTKRTATVDNQKNSEKEFKEEENKELKEAKATIEKLEAEIKDLKRAINELKDICDEITILAENREKEIEKIAIEKDKLSQKVVDTSNEFDKYKEKMLSLNEDYTSLIKLCSDREEEIIKLREDNLSLVVELEKYKKEVSESSNKPIVSALHATSAPTSNSHILDKDQISEIINERQSENNNKINKGEYSPLTKDDKSNMGVGEVNIKIETLAPNEIAKKQEEEKNDNPEPVVTIDLSSSSNNKPNNNQRKKKTKAERKRERRLAAQKKKLEQEQKEEKDYAEY